MKKKLIIAVVALIVLGAAVAIYFIAFHNPVISKFTIKTGAANGKTIPLPPGTRQMNLGKYEMENFTTNQSAGEVNKFYEEYTYGLSKMIEEKQNKVFYYDEEQQLVFKWSIFRDNDDGTCEFMIEYDDYNSEEYKPIK